MSDTKPENMDLKSMGIAQEKRDALKQLFPEVFTEDKIDFEQLRRVMGDWVEPGKERYGLNWPGKAECMKVIQAPSIATLKPARKESVNFDETENLFIEGDNLEVLKLLQKAYFGKIKMIYIDPPYNTGKEFIYPDKYQENLDTYLAYTGQVDDEGKKFATNTDAGGRYHANWLNMMYPRLYLARNLLRQDGYICVSIGEDEVTNLRLLMDLVFGEEQFINCVSVLSKVAAGASGGGEDKKLKKNIEYLLIYSKNSEDMNDVSHMYSSRKLIDVIEEMREEESSWKYTSILVSKGDRQYFTTIKDGDGNPIEIYKYSNVARSTINRQIKSEGLSEEEAYEKYFEYIFSDTNAQTSIRTRVIDAVESLTDNELIDVEYVPRSGKDKGKKVVHSYVSKTVRRVIWLHDVAEWTDEGILKKEKVGTLWSDFDFNNLGKEGSVPFPNGKKPIKLIQRCLELSKSNDGIVLDFFAGSASTAHAVLEQNKQDNGTRKYIVAQLPEQIDAKDQQQKPAVKFCEANGLEYIITEMTKARLRNLTDEYSVNNSADLFDGEGDSIDFGFKAFSLSSSNFSLWDGDTEKAEDLAKQLELHVDHIDQESSAEDILYELLLKAGFELTTKVEKKAMAGKDVYAVSDGAMLICLDKAITSELIDALADANPLQVICLDEGFKGNDQLKTNAVQTFKSRAKEDEEPIVFRTV